MTKQKVQALLRTSDEMTYAILEVDESTYDDIKRRLLATGYGHAVKEQLGGDFEEVIDMQGLAIGCVGLQKRVAKVRAAERGLIAVTCIREPRGDHGLEGFLLQEEYQAKVLPNEHIRLYLRDLADEWQPAGTVTRTIARRYFKVPEGEE